MKNTRLALHLLLSIGLVGCGSPVHGPATRVVATKTDRSVGPYGDPEMVKTTTTVSRLSDAQGREWTETAVKVEDVPGGLPQIEAELFEEALRKSQQVSE
jgi:hypothetical protein